MAGIYIHIPFCRQKCYYCDFYKTINTGNIELFVSSVIEEANIRQKYLDSETVKTIYLGGGTPSVLTSNQLAVILNNMYKNFDVDENAEITIEVNPDDLDKNYLQELYSLGINRLSIGVQSFEDELLQKMNRRHNAKQAIGCIEDSIKAGFTNVSIDFIYGLPGLTEKQWKKTLQKAFSMPVQHLSAYHLTYHKGTAFYTWLKKGTLIELKEHESLHQFEILLEMAAKGGFEMYEISNFTKNACYSKHNTSYWTGEIYLGLGPSAHSFNKRTRQWNVAGVDAYVKSIQQRKSLAEIEKLTEKDRFNEYILTRIRTKWGIDSKDLEKKFGTIYKKEFLKNIQKQLEVKNGFLREGIFVLSKKGYFVSDDISADLMII